MHHLAQLISHAEAATDEFILGLIFRPLGLQWLIEPSDVHQGRRPLLTDDKLTSIGSYLAFNTTRVLVRHSTGQ
jgi:hypothetical protein